MMDDASKLAFVHKMSKMALEHVTMPQHLDAGGVVVGQQANGNAGGVQGSINGASNSVGQVGQASQNTFGNITQAGLSPVGGAFQGLGQTFTTQNGYQAQLAPTTNIDYSGAIGQSVNNALSGYGQSQSLLGRQQQLEGQLGDEAAGGGPNPAQAALNQSTGQNIQQQAALAAATRGAGANAGLIASNAAQQGAATQQQAVGQGATLQAQQQLAARQGQQQQQAAEQSNIQGEQGIQGGIYGASANANNAQNNSSIANYGQAQGINSQVAQNNSNAVNKEEGQLSGAAALALLYRGGVVPSMPDHIQKMAKAHYPQKYAQGGIADYGVSSGAAPAVNIPNEVVAQSSSSGGGGGASSMLSGLMAHGGAVNSRLKSGGQVPGQPKVDHDAYKNDTVSAKLSPGEVVIDLNTLKDKGKLGQMARFVAANIERKKSGRKP